MEITGKINLFVNEKEISDGRKIREYVSSVAHKNEDGTYDHASIEVKFGKENFPNEKLSQLQLNTCYSLDLEKAFLDVRSFTTKEGKTAKVIFIKVLAGTLTDAKECKKQALPF